MTAKDVAKKKEESIDDDNGEKAYMADTDWRKSVIKNIHIGKERKEVE